MVIHEFSKLKRRVRFPYPAQILPVKFERGSPSILGGPLSHGMFYIYVLKSLKDNRTYVGYTNNLEERLNRHNSGQVQSTKYRLPLELIFSEKFNTSEEARKRELYWKGGGGRRKLKSILGNP